jgi:hypothetical protein
MSKLIFFDIDGTLVDFSMHCPDSTIQALRLAQKHGHKIAICSGRPISIVYPFLLELGFDGIVAAAGAYVKKGDEVIYHHTFETEQVVTLVHVLQQHGAGYFMQGTRGIFVTEEHKKGIQRNEPESDASRDIHSKMTVCEHPELVEGLECGVYFDSDLIVSQMQKEVDEATGGYFQITGSSLGEDVIYSGEITCKGVNKATGMQILMDSFGIGREECIAFGDGPNDFEMIQYAQTGVVMGNGFSELKKIADYVTTNINEDGIWNGMKHLGLI